MGTAVHEKEKTSLKDVTRDPVEEARMVVPAIQALFGFQTMAVFNNRFAELPGLGMFAFPGLRTRRDRTSRY